jgi:hypothetical protein
MVIIELLRIACFSRGGKSKERKESQGGRKKIGTSKFIEKLTVKFCIHWFSSMVNEGRKTVNIYLIYVAFVKELSTICTNTTCCEDENKAIDS